MIIAGLMWLSYALAALSRSRRVGGAIRKSDLWRKGASNSVNFSEDNHEKDTISNTIPLHW